MGPHCLSASSPGQVQSLRFCLGLLPRLNHKSTHGIAEGKARLLRPRGPSHLPEDIHFSVLQKAGGHVRAFSPEALLNPKRQQRRGTTQTLAATTHLHSKPPSSLHCV